MYIRMLIAMCFLLNFAANGLRDILREEDENRSRYLEFVDVNGVSHVIDTKPTSVISIFRPESVKFLLCTRKNPIIPQELTIGNRDDLKTSNFNSNFSTAVIVHGWWGNGYEGLNPIIKEAYFLQSDTNIISVDWSANAHDADYSASVGAVPYVGETIARFLEFLNREAGASFGDMHLIGYSLGAHIVGNAGRSLQGGKVARVTALDPAGPLWADNPNRLRDTDALYVEAIHTNGGPAGFGTLQEWGAANFYPNGGIIQPGCVLAICSHGRSYEFFAESVKYNNLIAQKCSGMTSMLLNYCNGEEAPMGNSDLTKSRYGIYRVNTASEFPLNIYTAVFPVYEKIKDTKDKLPDVKEVTDYVGNKIIETKNTFWQMVW